MENVLFEVLIKRIAEKRRRDGDVAVTLSEFEQLVREALEPTKPQLEPGYPKQVYRMPEDPTPWVPKAPPVPQSRWVTSSQEEIEAQAQGFTVGGAAQRTLLGYPKTISRPSEDPTKPSEYRIVNSPEEEEAVMRSWEKQEVKR